MVGRGGHGVQGSRSVAVRVGAALLLGLVALLLTAGTAAAQTAPGPPPPSPRPYGGALDRMDPGSEIKSEQVLEVGMLTLGTVNGLAFAVAMVASRMRGPSAAQTRRALINRTGAGTVSESRRERRARARLAESARRTPGGPRGLAPRPAPDGAVPEQVRPAVMDERVPAGRGGAVEPGGPRPVPVRPAGVRTPVRR